MRQGMCVNLRNKLTYFTTKQPFFSEKHPLVNIQYLTYPKLRNVSDSYFENSDFICASSFSPVLLDIMVVDIILSLCLNYLGGVMNYKDMKLNDIKPYVGSMNQLARVRTSVLDDGKGRGIRIADVDNGSGLRFSVLLDRGMDIGDASFNGV